MPLALVLARSIKEYARLDAEYGAHQDRGLTTHDPGDTDCVVFSAPFFFQASPLGVTTSQFSDVFFV